MSLYKTAIHARRILVVIGTFLIIMTALHVYIVLAASNGDNSLGYSLYISGVGKDRMVLQALAGVLTLIGGLGLPLDAVKTSAAFSVTALLGLLSLFIVFSGSFIGMFFVILLAVYPVYACTSLIYKYFESRSTPQR